MGDRSIPVWYGLVRRPRPVRYWYGLVRDWFMLPVRTGQANVPLSATLLAIERSALATPTDGKGRYPELLRRGGKGDVLVWRLVHAPQRTGPDRSTGTALLYRSPPIVMGQSKTAPAWLQRA